MAGKNDTVKDSDRTSILVPSLERCFVCGTNKRICLHEVFFGTANRKKSKEDGMVLPLCFEHHQGANGVHFNSAMDDYLKEAAEKIWIDTYTDNSMPYEERVERFIARYGKNYLGFRSEDECTDRDDSVRYK